MPVSIRPVFYKIISAAICLSCVLAVGPASGPAESATARQLVDGSLKSLSSHTNQLVQQVQVFLQSSGRWTPVLQGPDMHLCQTLQSFQQSVDRMKRNNGSKPYKVIQSDFQQLQMQAQNLDQLIKQRAQSPLVSATWTQVSQDIVFINQSLYTVLTFNSDNFYDSEGGLTSQTSGSTFQPGFPANAYNPVNTVSPFQRRPYFPGNPYYPGFRPTNINITENSTFDPDPDFQGSSGSIMPGAVPGMIPGRAPVWKKSQDSSEIISNLRSASNQAERFVKQLTVSLQSRGSWPPPQGTPDLQLCENVHDFQTKIRKLESDLQDNVSFSILQNEIRDIGFVSQNIDQLLLHIRAGNDVMARWNEVRSNMTLVYRSIFAGGSNDGTMWMR